MSGKIAKPLCDNANARREAMQCTYLLDADGDPAPARYCTAPRQAGSAYCPQHHAICHLAGGSAAEQQQLREIEALARAVGGRRGDAGKQPPTHLLRRLERVARKFSRPERSPIVRRP